MFLILSEEYMVLCDIPVPSLFPAKGYHPQESSMMNCNFILKSEPVNEFVAL